MPKCDRYRELCSLSLDTELSDDDAVMLFRHLAECPACAAYLEDLHQMQSVWNDLKEPLPEDLHEKIMQAVTEQAEKQVNVKNKGKRPFPVFTAIAAAAACVMLALSGSFAGILGKSTSGLQEEKTGVPTGQSTLEQTNPDDEQGIAKARITPEPNQSDVQDKQESMPNTDSNNTQSIQPSVIEPKSNSDDNKDNQQVQTDDNQNKDQSKQESSSPEKSSSPVTTFSVGDSQKRVQSNTAEEQSVKIPSALQTSTFAFSCVAVGSGEVPTLDNAKFIEKNGNTYYFKVTGSISDFDKNLETLKQGGFDTSMRTDLGVKIDTSAQTGLLILVLNE